MAKGTYIGVGNVARKVKKAYIGVNGVARKIKKMYIGVGGVARCIYGGGEIVYHGTISNLGIARRSPKGLSFGNHYALFAGGYKPNDSNVLYNRIDAYNPSLTLSASSMNASKVSIGAATAGDSYAVFVGGSVYTSGQQRSSNTASSVSSSLTYNSLSNLGYVKESIIGASVGNYALFSGGYNYNASSYNSYHNYLYAYDSSLTRTNRSMSAIRDRFMTATIGNHALFAGGTIWNISGTSASSTLTTTVEVYDSSLTRTFATDISHTIGWRTSAFTDRHAIFFNAYQSSSTVIDGYVDVYNESLTRSSAVSPLSYFSNTYINYMTSLGLHDCVMFVVRNLCTLIYDSSLTIKPITNLSNFYGADGTIAAIGDYAIYPSQSPGENVEAYKYV